jgi:putative flippase GtrA
MMSNELSVLIPTGQYVAHSTHITDHTLLQLLLPLRLMRRHIHSARDLIIPIIDFFYPPFKRLMDLQTFRYAACGGGNVALGFVIYSITYKYILKEENLHLGFYAFKSHVAALLIASVFNFCIGFFLMKFVVFSNSDLRGRIQLFRYLINFLFALMLNYILLKIFVERLRIHAIPAQIMTTCIVVLFSYLFQKHYTFRSSSNENNEEVTS